MEGFKEFTGKSLDDAIREACSYYDTSRERLEIDIVQDAKSGIFGLVGARKAIIRARRVQLRDAVDDILGRSKKAAAAPKVEASPEATPAVKTEADPAPAKAPAKTAEKAKGNGKDKAPAHKQAVEGDAHVANSDERASSAASGQGQREKSQKPRREGKETREPREGRERHERQGHRHERTERNERNGNRQERNGNRIEADGNRVEVDGNRAEGHGGERFERKPRREAKPQRDNRDNREGREGRDNRDNRRPQNKHHASKPAHKPAPTEHMDSMGFGDDVEESENVRRIPLEELDQERLQSVTLEAVGMLTRPIVGEVPLEMKLHEGRVHVHLDCDENSGLLIGREGQTLASLQYITSRIVSRAMDAAVRVQLDAGDYRTRQDEKLSELATALAERVRATGKAHSTRPLSSYHRRIVHVVLQDATDLVTRSSGDGPLKRVIIQRKRG